MALQQPFCYRGEISTKVSRAEIWEGLGLPVSPFVLGINYM